MHELLSAFCKHRFLLQWRYCFELAPLSFLTDLLGIFEDLSSSFSLPPRKPKLFITAQTLTSTPNSNAKKRNPDLTLPSSHTEPLSSHRTAQPAIALPSSPYRRQSPCDGDRYYHANVRLHVLVWLSMQAEKSFTILISPSVKSNRACKLSKSPNLLALLSPALQSTQRFHGRKLTHLQH